MSSTLSLETSKKIYELVGEYGTEWKWERITDKNTGEWLLWEKLRTPFNDEICEYFGIAHERYPAPTFSELLRILPKIAEKKGDWSWANFSHIRDRAADLCEKYYSAPTEPEAMAAVDKYLSKLL